MFSRAEMRLQHRDRISHPNQTPPTSVDASSRHNLEQHCVRFGAVHTTQICYPVAMLKAQPFSIRSAALPCCCFATRARQLSPQSQLRRQHQHRGAVLRSTSGLAADGAGGAAHDEPEWYRASFAQLGQQPDAAVAAAPPKVLEEIPASRASKRLLEI